MKRLVLCVVLAACARAQTNPPAKPAVTPADYGKWETLGASVFSPDGKWIAYSIRRVEGTHELRVTPAAGGATTVLASGANPAFSSDSRWLAYAITQSEAEADRARARTGGGATGATAAAGARRPAQNKLGILDLSTGAKTAVDDVQSFSFSDQETFLAFQRYAPQRPTPPTGATPPPSDPPPDPAGSTLTIRNLANGNDVTFGNVTSFAWQDKGTRIAMTIGAEGRAGNGLNVFDPAKGDLKIMDSGQAIFTGVAWRKDSSDLAALRSRKDGQYEGESYTVLAWKSLGEKRFTDAPVGKRVVAARTPQWSDDGRTLFVGLADWDRKVDPVKGDGDPSNVEIWHARDVNVISEQKLRIARDRDRNALAAWNLDANKLVALSTNPKENVQLPRQGNRALAIDESPYETDGMFGRRYADISKIDISTGARTEVVRRLVPPVWFSPGGRYALNFLDGEYTIYDLENGTQRNVSKEARVNFTNKNDDYPVRHKPPYGVAGWTKDDASVIVYDETDLWQLFPDGAKPQRLTDGSADQLRHRYFDVRDTGDGRGGGPRFGGGREEAIDLSKPVYVHLYGMWNKKSGYGRLVNGKVERSVLLDKIVGRLMKAKTGDAYAFTAEAFDDSTDLFVAGADLKNAKQVSETNPFAAQYAWGRSTLVDYKSPRGERLQGALIYPANYETGKQYPMIVHIYERESQLLHRYTVPSERSPYNQAAWSARGYFVFMPDIVFRPREPGMSVVECVTAATKAVIATGMVDPKRIGLIGHSWGGFGTAFVLTQTDMFAAGAAGGPLTNLVSSYGEIYWNTGVPETSHAEVGQERMEVPLWEDPGAYIRNSAVFSVNKMRNPLLLCVGDKDGASDWHQDLELYNLARRAGKQLVLLVYPGENHGLAVKANQIDYHRRINAWFDTYLKGNDTPAWISKGVSVLEREKELKQMKKDTPATAPTGGGAIEPF